jgi:hypothetical protein
VWQSEQFLDRGQGAGLVIGPAQNKHLRSLRFGARRDAIHDKINIAH